VEDGSPAIHVTSLPATLDFWPTPEVSDPISTAVFEGARIDVWAEASGRRTIRLQWFKDGAELHAHTNELGNIFIPSARPEHSGNYFAVASNESGSTTSAVAVVRVDSNFVQTRLPLNLIGGPKKCGWIDYNNDGWQDLYLKMDSLSLLPNNGRGELTNHLSEWVVGFEMASWADYNHDGLLDALAVSSDKSILRQESNGAFTQVRLREPWGLAAYDGTWADYDRDGDLDILAVGGDVYLGRNDGNDIITRVTNALPSSGYYSGTWGDYNNDGFPDLFMTHSYGEDTLYRNNRDGTFTALAGPPSTIPKTYSLGGSWADYDNDGDLDLFVGGRYGNSLYENLGDGSFRNADAGAIVTDSQETWGAAWTDYDADGWQDLYVANKEGDHLYRNNADGTFTAEPLGWLGDYPVPSLGAAWGDVSGDGRPDLFVCLDGGWVYETYVYVNNVKTNNWLTIQCVGRASNRSAIGAKVRVKATIRGRTFWQLREITASNAFGNQNSLDPFFGLGDAATAELVRIEWPSGLVEERRNISANQRVTITESPGIQRLAYTQRDGCRLQIIGRPGDTYDIQASTDLRAWSYLTTVSNSTPACQWFDTSATNYPHRFYRAVALK
jgi:hypothetical protein